MKCYVGIDLGSTTTKAVVMDEGGEVLGRGITNSRSNYDTASRVSKMEALVATRLTLFRRGLEDIPGLAEQLDELLAALERNFRLELFLEQLQDLENTCREAGRDLRFADRHKAIAAALESIFEQLRGKLAGLFAPGVVRKSDFFRDLAGAEYMHVAEQVAKDSGIDYEALLNLYD
ncbi:MAG: benzoyl-CoA reductase subunit A, partial [Gammaproteobacteria bacterium]|nr:benzoyl-CoA reductase subunit A [Gammaproteobacteria bacterium]